MTLRVLLFPGLAADARMFEPQLRAFPFIETPEWIAPEGAESVESYCDRMADSMDLEERPLVVGGVSFGGMIAQVMASRIQADATLLIATRRPGEPHPPGARLFMRFFNRMPVSWLRWIMHRDFFLERFEPIDASTKKILMEMLEEADWDFI